MKNMMMTIAAVCCLLAHVATADVWDNLAAYRYGDEPDTAAAAFELLENTPVDHYALIEGKLIQVLTSGDATQDGKAFACRILQQIGTEQSVPALSALLGHDVLSDYARLTLERMQDSAKAGEALRDALGRAPEKLKVGIIGSLGERRDSAAVEPLAKLAADDNPAVAAAALLALGKIGNAEAADHLGSLKVADSLHGDYLDALIACARGLGGTGAASLYRKVLAGHSTSHRIAAMAGLAKVDPDTGAATILAALRDDDYRMRQGALTALAEVKGEGLTTALLPVLSEFKGEKQSALLRAFGLRGDKAALDKIVGYVASEEADVRDAAIIAAGRLGDGATATMLLGLDGANDATSSVRVALNRMPGPDIDAALIEALASPQRRAATIPVLAARGFTAATPKLMELLREDNPHTKHEAWSALGVLAGAKDLNAMMQAVVALEDTDELSQALEAIRRVFAREEDKSACFRVISGYYGRAQPATKEVILSLGAIAGDRHALNLVRTEMQSESKDLHGTALRALAAWPNIMVENDLLNLAQNASEEVERLLALQGYIRLAGLDPGGYPDRKRMEVLKTALDLAKRPEEKRLIVGILQKIERLEALELLSVCAQDPAMAAEAELAMARLLWPLREEDMDRIWATAYEIRRSRNRTVVDLANRTLGDIAESRREWQVSDVYSGAHTRRLFDQALPPEQRADDVRWNEWTREDGLTAAGTPDSRCVYLKTMLHVDKKQTANVEIRTDAAVKVWLNGALVHEAFPERARRTSADGLELEPERDLPDTLLTALRTEEIEIELEAGESVLLVKIVSEIEEPTFACILRQQDGLPVESPPKPALGPRDVDPYIGLYEGVYELDGETIYAEARVTTLGKDSPYRATVFVDPKSLDYRHFWIWSGDMYDDLDVYTCPEGKTKGVNFAYYADNDSKLDFDNSPPAKTGTIPYFSLDPREAEISFQFKFTGYVKIPEAGRHRFFLASNNGSRLAIDGKVIVENHVWQKSGVVELEAGLHPITVTYFQHRGPYSLKVGVLNVSEEDEKHIVLKGAGLDTVWQGRLLPDKLVLTPEDPAKGRFVLHYVDRQSPTLGLEPPEGATVLLGDAGDGGPPSIREWTNKTWVPLPDGSMLVGNRDTMTFKEFGDQRIHLEFMLPFEPDKLGQGRGNSGVYVQGGYELQILDSFGFEPGRSTCGAVYYIQPIQRPATLPPLTWQTFDAIFRAARFSEDGEVEQNPVFEQVKLNGIVIHENLSLPTRTFGGISGPHPKVGPTLLQDHKNPVRFRNIWIEPL